VIATRLAESSAAAHRLSTMLVVLLVSGSAVLTASFRFLGTPEFNNDHFVHLTAAQQVLFGDWPSRDFIDIGRPLQILASAAAQRLIGPDLFAEALLVSAGFGAAAALTLVVVLGLTRSLVTALSAVVVEVAAFPRTYSYPKVLAIAAGLWLICGFAREPNFHRKVMMAAGVVVAFLFRHDLGVFAGVGGLAASMLAVPAQSWRERCLSGAVFVGLALVLVAPYVIYVQATEGAANYFATALQQNQEEAGYVWPSPLAGGNAWDAQLLYLFHLLPVITLCVCLVERKGTARDDWRRPFVISVACVAVAVNFGLIRDVLRARIPDAIVPAVVLGAWLVHRAGATGRRVILIPVTVVAIAVGLALADAANIGEVVDRAGLDAEIWSEPGLLGQRFVERSTQLHDRFGSSPSRAAAALRPFLDYLDRCTTPSHRLFLGGLIPEVAYLARRPFAGGGYEHYNFSSERNQRRVIERLRGQLVPFALIPRGGDSELDLPLVAGYLQQRYVPLADFAVDASEHVEILIGRDLSAASRDSTTGWPCLIAARQG
jgi:hypothetical protein